MPTKLFKPILKHKLIVGISLILIAVGGYFSYQRLAKGQDLTRYVTAAVEKGPLIVSLSGSGQVAVSNQIDVKSKVSGEVVYVGIKNGQEVKAGALLAQIDNRDAQKALGDAEITLETAKLDLEEILSPPDELSLLQTEGALASAKRNLEKLLEPVDKLTLLQAESSLITAQDNLTKLNFTQANEYQKALDAEQKTEDESVEKYPTSNKSFSKNSFSATGRLTI